MVEQSLNVGHKRQYERGGAAWKQSKPFGDPQPSTISHVIPHYRWFSDDDFSSPGLLWHSSRKGPDAFSCPPPDHRCARSADHPGEEAGGGGAGRGPAPASPEEAVKVQSCQVAAEVTGNEQIPLFHIELFLVWFFSKPFCFFSTCTNTPFFPASLASIHAGCHSRHWLLSKCTLAWLPAVTLCVTMLFNKLQTLVNVSLAYPLPGIHGT